VYEDEGTATAAAVDIDKTLKTKGIDAHIKVTEFYNE
jgi:hypothetical protein